MPLITQGFATFLRVGTLGRWYYLACHHVRSSRRALKGVITVSYQRS
jgi:hypothetical protein